MEWLWQQQKQGSSFPWDGLGDPSCWNPQWRAEGTRWDEPSVTGALFWWGKTKSGAPRSLFQKYTDKNPQGNGGSERRGAECTHTGRHTMKSSDRHPHSDNSHFIVRKENKNKSEIKIFSVFAAGIKFGQRENSENSVWVWDHLWLQQPEKAGGIWLGMCSRWEPVTITGGSLLPYPQAGMCLWI